jgi:hypothetical protein
LLKIQVPSIYNVEGVDADLVIFVTVSNSPNSQAIAWANSCILDALNGRPRVGSINYNLAYISSKVESFENAVDISLHEVIFDEIFNKGI